MDLQHFSMNIMSIDQMSVYLVFTITEVHSNFIPWQPWRLWEADSLGGDNDASEDVLINGQDVVHFVGVTGGLVDVKVCIVLKRGGLRCIVNACQTLVGPDCSLN